MSWQELVTLEQGDIAQSDAEAVVNAANHELWMGSGVAGALKRAGGGSIEQEALRQAPIAVGESVLTAAGDLPALHVIHAAAMSAGRPTSAGNIRAATASALALAAEHQIESIAFPALGTGAGGVGFAECARAMYSAIAAHAESNDLPDDIRIVLWGENALAVFQAELESAV